MNTSTPNAFGRRRDRRALLTAVVGITCRLLSASVQLVMIPAATKLLGIERYGVWLAASSVLSLLMISDFGIGSGLINAVSAVTARDQNAEARSFTATAYVAFGSLAIALLGLVSLLAHSKLLSHWLGVAPGSMLDSEGRGLFIMMGFLIAGSAFLNVVSFLVAALQEGFFTHLAQISASAVTLYWILFQHPRSLVAFALASGLPLIVSYSVLSLIVYGIRHPEMLPDFHGVTWHRMKVIWYDSSRLLIAQIADTVIAFASNVLVASQLGSRHVPEVSVTLAIMQIISFLSCMFILPLWPAYVEASVRGDWAWIRKAFRRGVLLSLGTALLACSGYTLIYRWFLHTWSPTLPIPSAAFVVLTSMWYVVYVWNKNAMALLNGLGYTNIRAWVAPLSAFVFISSAMLLLNNAEILAIPIAGLASAVSEGILTSQKAFSALAAGKSITIATNDEVLMTKPIEVAQV